MNILIIHTFYFPEIKGGAEYSLKKLAEGLVERGHSVFVLCDSAANQDDLICGVHILRRRMKCLRRSRSFFSRLTRAALEIINPLNARYVLEAISLSKPDVVYSNCLERISLVAWLVPSLMRVKIIDTQRVYVLLEMAGGRYKIGNGVWRTANRWLSRCVDVSVFISDYMQKVFHDQGFFAGARSIVIRNAIDFDATSVAEYVRGRIEKIPFRQTVKFVYLGALSEHKGVHILLDAINEMSDLDAELHIAGDGVLKDLVRDAASRCKNVRYYGWIDEESVNRLLASCDVLVCPSIWAEPFGRVVLDAYKQGLPVIASRMGGLAETVIDNYSGLLVEPDDKGSLIVAMRRLAIDKELYKACCMGVEHTLKQYSLEKYLDSFEDALSEQPIRSLR